MPAERLCLEPGDLQPGHSRRRRLAAAMVAIVGLAGVAAGLALWGGHRGGRTLHVTAASRVKSAVGATVASGRWDMTFQSSFRAPPGTTAGPAQGLTLSGHGTTNVNPFAMVAYADVPGYGQITTMMSGSTIWEFGGGNYGTSPGSPGSPPGASIAGFAASVEGTLGPEQGAVVMLGLGSATGYLDLVQQAITTATATGTGILDGVPVTYYKVSVDPTKLATDPRLTPEEAAAVNDALRLLSTDGFQQMTDTVAVDNGGRIRSKTEVVTFADGDVATGQTTLSNFGCAATVVLPGAQAPPTTVPPCQSGAS